MNELMAALEDALEDAEKFDNGNQAAGTRVRKALMETKKKCDFLRKSIQTVKNAR
jgi:hypothetical protein